MEAEATFPMRKNREDLLNGPPWKMSWREDAIETPLTEIRMLEGNMLLQGIL